VVVLQTPALPRLALSKAEAADVLGVSVDFFEEHIQPDLKIVYKADGDRYRSANSKDGWSKTGAGP
jgi:hypothetical protein